MLPESGCLGLNMKGPHRFVWLNTWFPVGVTGWWGYGTFRRQSLAGGSGSQELYNVYSDLTSCSLSVSFLSADAVWLLRCCWPWEPPLFHHDGLCPFRTINRNKLFSCKLFRWSGYFITATEMNMHPLQCTHTLSDSMQVGSAGIYPLSPSPLRKGSSEARPMSWQMPTACLPPSVFILFYPGLGRAWTSSLKGHMMQWLIVFYNPLRLKEELF